MAQKVQAKIVSITRLNDTIWQYTLKPAQFIPYQAGQYLQIHKPEGESFYSIANAPSAEQVYELHVRHRSQKQLGSEQEALSVSLPYGRCDVSHLHPHKPILFLAFGTGFSSIRAMIEHLSTNLILVLLNCIGGLRLQKIYMTKRVCKVGNRHKKTIIIFPISPREVNPI